MDRTSRALVAAAFAAVLLPGCGGGGKPKPAPPGVDRVEVAPAAFLLAGGEGAVQLGARALAADGTVLARPVRWISLSPGVVAVGADGRATAAAGLGSAQIVAEVDGVRSAPVVGLVATPAAGAVLVGDAQVVGTPLALDPADALGLGWRYQVRLAGAGPLAPGSLVVGTGQQPLAGRVVAVEAAGSDQLATLEVVPAHELFGRLVVKETIDLSQVPPVLEPEAAPFVGLRRDPAGGWRAESFAWLAAEPPFGLPNVGPFHCAATVELPLVEVRFDAFRISPVLEAIVDYDSARPEGQRLRDLRVKGGVDGELDAKVRLGVAPEAKIKCEARLYRIPVPLNGALAWLLGANVPVGLGAELGERFSLDSLGADLTGKVHATVEVGATCPPETGCQPVCDVVATASGALKPVLPALSAEAFTVELSGAGYAIAKLGFGVPWVEGLNVDALEVKAGAKASVDYRSMVGQAADPAYHSSLRLAGYWEAEAASSVKWLRDRLELKVFDFKKGAETELARLPRGRVEVVPAAVAVGEQATITVTLEESRWLGQAAVARVDVHRERALAGGGFELVPVCSVTPADGDQRVFRCQRSFGAAEQANHVLHAFARIRDMGVELDLEVDDDAHAHLKVGSPVVVIPDPNLEFQVRVWIQKSTGDITEADMLRLVELPYGHEKDIATLEGLQYAKNLETLLVNLNRISDLSPLAGLGKLKWLELGYNQVSDLGSLSGLTALEELGLAGNQVESLAPLSGLQGLTFLEASGNRISDLAPLSGLRALDMLSISGNRLQSLAPLAPVTSLRILSAERNRIVDLSPLRGLTRLELVSLGDNLVSDLGPLLENAGLGTGDTVRLRRNCLDLSPLPAPGTQAWQDLQALRARGVSMDVEPQGCAP